MISEAFLCVFMCVCARDKAFTETTVPLRQRGLPVLPTLPPVSLSPLRLQIRATSTAPSFHRGTGGPNSGPRACMSWTEPSLQLVCLFAADVVLLGSRISHT